jgi:tetratricopeptide (TPR) repeat protein
MAFCNVYISILVGSCLAISSLNGQNEVRAAYDLGVKYGTLGMFDSAKVAFEKALKIDNIYTPAKLNLIIVNEIFSKQIKGEAAKLYFQSIVFGNLNNPEGKIQMLNEALKIDPDFSLAYNERGIVNAQKNLYKEAISDYEVALKFHPELSEIYINKALSCDKLEKYTEAIEAYKNFLKYTPVDYLEYIIYARHRIAEIQTSIDESYHQETE